MKAFYKASITLCLFLAVFALFLGIAGADDVIEVPKPEYVSINMSTELRAYINNMLDAGPTLINNNTKAVNIINYSLIDPNTGNEKTFTSCDIVNHDDSTDIDKLIGHLTFNTHDNTFIFEGTALTESIHGTYNPPIEEVTFENDVGETITASQIYSTENEILTLTGIEEADGMVVEEADGMVVEEADGMVVEEADGMVVEEAP